MSRLLSFFCRRNFLLFLNTAISAASSVVLLLGAARSLDPFELSTFSLVQLLVMTAVMLQRALFLSPALAGQRSHGQSTIPLSWAALVSLPGAVLVGAVIALLTGLENHDFALWMLAGITVAGVALVQDVLRFNLLSRGRIHGAVFSDGLWLLLICLILVPNDFLQSAVFLVIYWATAGIAAVTGAFAFCLKCPSAQSESKSSIRRTWKLGKWSGLDAGLSATANLAPMLMTALVIGSEHAGTYRVLQSSLGPLNILSTSLITMLGLDSWKFVTWESLSKLQGTVRKAVLLMAGFAVLYIAIAEIAIIYLAELRSPELMRIAIIVGIVGILGAATSPLSAASLALGYQKDGALLRSVIVTFSLSISALVGFGIWVPWNDPIGTVTFFAAATGLAGWTFSYHRAIRVEKARVPAPDNLLGSARHLSSN